MNGDSRSARPSVPGSVLVMGAGAIGCYLGGCLQASGVPVTFVGRPRVLDELRRHGLHLTDLDGRDQTVGAEDLVLHEAVPPDARPCWVLLAVKSSATEAAARELAAALPPGMPVVSMQNGVSNAAVAQAAAPGLQAIAGMVPFNVARLGAGHFHRGTDGALAAADHPALRAWPAVFAAAGLDLALQADLRGVQWAKLLLNLNNPVNALSGLPLKAQLEDRGLRRCLAALQQEGLDALRAAGIEPARLTPLPPRLLLRVLRLPSPLFRLVAARMLRIDAKARSSMAEDFDRGAATEIDALCGEVVRLAGRHGVAAPLNTKMVELIEGWPARPQAYSGAALQRALGI